MSRMDYMSWILILLTGLCTNGQLLNGTCRDAIHCGDHGDCVQSNDTTKFYCHCDQGFGGALCETKCELKCESNKKCVVHRNETKTCICEDCEVHDLKLATPPDCPVNHGGVNCSIRVNPLTDPCDDNPCIHGTCFPTNNAYVCRCDPGFWGKQCEKGTDNCIVNHCDPGSKCQNAQGGYYCICDPGRFGTFCEKTACTEKPGVCNHGECIPTFPSTTDFTCACHQGFYGKFCEKDINECHDPYLCGQGACNNLLGSYECECPRGITGRHCDRALDMCRSIKCENGGECNHLSTREPFCRCKPGFVGKYCEIECPEGFTGWSCNRTTDTPACARRKKLCLNGGVCMQGHCQCLIDFTGDNCELTQVPLKITCENNPCQHNGTCVPVNDSIGYVCICPNEYDGAHCEIIRESCIDYPCANGGKCSPVAEGEAGFKCTCPGGYEGPRCQIEKELSCNTPIPCYNEGVCVSDGITSQCHCKIGFTGRKCELKTVLQPADDPLFRDLCAYFGCLEFAGDGQCNVDCNMAACNFDGGDCTAGRLPFSKCPYNCPAIFANGICNQECNIEDCLYDGMDCLPGVLKCPLRIIAQCVDKFGDGICDPQCNSEGCGYDGGDCDQLPKGPLLNDIRMVIAFTPLDFQRYGGAWLMDIGKTLRLAVRFQRDDVGPLIFAWNGTDAGERIKMNYEVAKLQKGSGSQETRREVEPKAVLVFLEVQEYCETNCMFSEATTIIDMLAAGLGKTNGDSSFGFPISQALIASPSPYASQASKTMRGWPSGTTLFYSFLALIIGLAVVAGIHATYDNIKRSRGRRIITAPTWIPPIGFAQPRPPPFSMMRENHVMLPKDPASELTLTNGICKRENKSKNMTYSVADETLLPPEEIPLHAQAAGSGEITEVLTKESVRQIDCKYKRNVLHWLAANFTGKSETLIPWETSQCIQAGALINQRDKEDMTPLMLAVRARRTRLVVVLMRAGADPTIFNSSEKSALHLAAANCDYRMMEILLTDPLLVKDIDQMDRNGKTALMIAAGKRGSQQVSMARLLISKGADVDENGKARHESPNYHGRTALHFAALVDNVDMVEYLISKKANVDQQDEAGQTPIMLAAKSGHENTVKLLVASLASLIITDSYSNTAAQLAIMNYHRELGEYLNEMSANMNRNDLVRQKHQEELKAKEQTKKQPGRATKQVRSLMPPPHIEGSPGCLNSTPLAVSTTVRQRRTGDSGEPTRQSRKRYRL